VAKPTTDYKQARQASGLLLVLLACALALLDGFRSDYEVNLFVLIAILLTGAAMFAVDVPGLAGLGSIFSGRDRRKDDEEEQP
jgi:hypothetical protein